jgi:hypothetical protein
MSFYRRWSGTRLVCESEKRGDNIEFQSYQCFYYTPCIKFNDVLPYEAAALYNHSFFYYQTEKTDVDMRWVSTDSLYDVW